MTYKEVYKGIGQEVLSSAEIDERVKALAKEIDETYLPGEVFLVPVLTGASIFFSALIQKIRIPVRTYPVFAGGIVSPGYFPEKILLVEDLIDTGRTLKLVGAELLELTKVEQVDICCLVHRGKIPLDDLPVKFVGFTLRGDKPLVGYGMDWNGYLRNLPSIYSHEGDRNV
jgi:hypoxanthine phosphoribosyltransferase